MPQVNTHYRRMDTEIQPTQRKRTVKLADRIWFQDGANPLVSMLKGKGYTDTAENQKVEWIGDSRILPTIRVLAATNAVTSLTLDGLVNTLVRVGDILYNPTGGEQMRITARTSTNQITVQRGFAGTTAAAIAAGDLILLGTGYGEGTRSPEGTVIYRDENFNYSQIFKHAVEITRNELKSPRWGENGDKRQERRKRVLELHKRSIETQLLFGAKSKSFDEAGNALYISAGVISYLTTNKLNITGGFTIDKFNNALAAIANMEASGDKVLMCGSDLLNAINSEGISKFAGGQGPVIKKYGVDVVEIVTSYGKVDVMFHPVISQVYPKMGLLLDLSNLRYTTIDDTSIEKDVHDRDYDGVKDQILTDATIQVWNEERHAVITLA